MAEKLERSLLWHNHQLDFGNEDVIMKKSELKRIIREETQKVLNKEALGGKFWVYFVGTRNGEWIEAANMKSAKWIFAKKNNLKSLAYIVASRKKV